MLNSVKVREEFLLNELSIDTPVSEIKMLMGIGGSFRIGQVEWHNGGMRLVDENGIPLKYQDINKETYHQIMLIRNIHHDAVDLAELSVERANKFKASLFYISDAIDYPDLELDFHTSSNLEEFINKLHENNLPKYYPIEILYKKKLIIHSGYCVLLSDYTCKDGSKTFVGLKMDKERFEDCKRKGMNLLAYLKDYVSKLDD